MDCLASVEDVLTQFRAEWIGMLVAPYCFVWSSEGLGMFVKCWMGGPAAVAVPITRAFAIIDAWDPWNAEARAPTGPGRYKLAEFFSMKPPAGSWEHAFDKKCRKMQAFVASVKVKKEAMEHKATMDMFAVEYDASSTHSVGKAVADGQRKRAL